MDNIKVIGITLIINLVLASLFNFYKESITLSDLLIDSALLSGRILNYAIFRLIQPDVLKSKKGRDVNEPSRY